MKQRRRRAKSKAAVISERPWYPSEIERCERDYRAGDKTALAHAIAICADRGLLLPLWAATAYVAGYKEIVDFRSDTWSSLFGTPVPKGKHLGALRKRRLKAFRVWCEVRSLHASGHSIDNDLFERVGAKMGIGATLAKQCYREEQQKATRAMQHTKEEAELRREFLRLKDEVARVCIEAGDLKKAKRLAALIDEIVEHREGGNRPLLPF